MSMQEQCKAARTRQRMRECMDLAWDVWEREGGKARRNRFVCRWWQDANPKREEKRLTASKRSRSRAEGETNSSAMANRFVTGVDWYACMYQSRRDARVKKDARWDDQRRNPREGRTRYVHIKHLIICLMGKSHGWAASHLIRGTRIK